jgi:hypothetical protein
MKKLCFLLLLTFTYTRVFCWGFFCHQEINRYAVFLLPPEMLVFFKPNIAFLSEHSVDPDKRRYLVASEGAHHFIDIDHYGVFPYPDLPHNWNDAVKKFSGDSLQRYGIVPWWIQTMMQRLTKAFREKNAPAILKLSAELGHYIADAHVPLHASSNHNGQLTNQEGIHAFWESRIPELLAEKNWNFFVGKAMFIPNPSAFTWDRVLESAAAADTVLRTEKLLSAEVPESRRFAFENRKGKITRQYATHYTLAYNNKLGDMVERRMRASIFAVASFWYTAWVNAGQPDLKPLAHATFPDQMTKEWEQLDAQWKAGSVKGRDCEN